MQPRYGATEDALPPPPDYRARLYFVTRRLQPFVTSNQLASICVFTKDGTVFPTYITHQRTKTISKPFKTYTCSPTTKRYLYTRKQANEGTSFFVSKTFCRCHCNPDSLSDRCTHTTHDDSRLDMSVIQTSSFFFRRGFVRNIL